MERKTWGILAALLWGLMLLAVLVVPVGAFIVPQMALQMKAQGARELPVFWQCVVDAGDVCNHRWYLVFPILIIGALLASRRALRR